MPGSCEYAAGDTAEIISIKFYEVLKREKEFDDLRKISGA